MLQIQSFLMVVSLPFPEVVTSVFLPLIFVHISLNHQKPWQLHDSGQLSCNQRFIGCFLTCVFDIPVVFPLYADIALQDCSLQYLYVVVWMMD
jgi:hypothetical protein